MSDSGPVAQEQQHSTTVTPIAIHLPGPFHNVSWCPSACGYPHWQLSAFSRLYLYLTTLTSMLLLKVFSLAISCVTPASTQGGVLTISSPDSFVFGTYQVISTCQLADWNFTPTTLHCWPSSQAPVFRGLLLKIAFDFMSQNHCVKGSGSLWFKVGEELMSFCHQCHLSYPLLHTISLTQKRNRKP